MALLYGAFRVRDGPRVLGAQRRPASRAESRQRRGELSEMQAIVSDPRGDQVEARQRAEAWMCDGVAQAIRRERGEERERRCPPLVEGGQRRHWVGVAIGALL